MGVRRCVRARCVCALRSRRSRAAPARLRLLSGGLPLRGLLRPAPAEAVGAAGTRANGHAEKHRARLGHAWLRASAGPKLGAVEHGAGPAQRGHADAYTDERLRRRRRGGRPGASRDAALGGASHRRGGPRAALRRGRLALLLLLLLLLLEPHQLLLLRNLLRLRLRCARLRLRLLKLLLVGSGSGGSGRGG